MKPKEPSQKKDTHPRQQCKKSKVNSPLSARGKHGGDLHKVVGLVKVNKHLSRKTTHIHSHTYTPTLQ